ncbi:MAG TPA: hypothetical protein VGJ87_03210, partial [Roseiflexaceae bacterium]
NPPYSDPDPWVEKALAHWLVGDVIQALLLVRSDPSTEYSRMLGHSPALLCMLKRVDFLAAADEPEDRQAIITQLSGAALVSRR